MAHIGPGSCARISGHGGSHSESVFTEISQIGKAVVVVGVVMAYINVLHVATALTLLLSFCLSLATLADASARPGRDWCLARLSKARWCALLAASVVPVLGWPVPVLYLRRVRPRLQRVET